MNKLELKNINPKSNLAVCMLVKSRKATFLNRLVLSLHGSTVWEVLLPQNSHWTANANFHSCALHLLASSLVCPYFLCMRACQLNTLPALVFLAWALCMPCTLLALPFSCCQPLLAAMLSTLLPLPASALTLVPAPSAAPLLSILRCLQACQTFTSAVRRLQACCTCCVLPTLNAWASFSRCHNSLPRFVSFA